MSYYMRWRLDGLSAYGRELEETQAKVSSYLTDLQDISRRLDPQVAGCEELGRALRAILDGTEGDLRRIRSEHRALSDVTGIYRQTERETLRSSESLPNGITERGLITNGWFSKFMR